MDGSTPWMCPQAHRALEFHSGWELLGEAEAGGPCSTGKEWGGNGMQNSQVGDWWSLPDASHKVQENQRYVLVGINPDASGEKLQQCPGNSLCTGVSCAPKYYHR